MSRVTDLTNRLDNCPAGDKGWREFEDLCDLIVDFVERFYLQHE